MRQCSEEIQDTEVDTRCFACGAVVGGGVVEVAVEMVEAQEGGGGGHGDVVWRVGEAAVGGAVCEHGGWGGEAVDFDAHEGEGGPA